MVILKDFAEYMDVDGLIHTRKCADGVASTLNGVCYTGEVLALMGWTKLCERSPDFIRHGQAIASCSDHGLLQRLPLRLGRTPQQGPDDYMGAFAGLGAVHMYDSIDEILTYGRRNFWVMNNENPGRFRPAAWFGRFPQIIGMGYWAARLKAPLFCNLWAAAALLVSQRKPPEQDQDAYRFSALLILVHSSQLPMLQSTLVRWAGRWWWRQFKRKGYSMRQILGRYLGGEYDHPLAILWGEYETEVLATGI